MWRAVCAFQLVSTSLSVFHSAPGGNDSDYGTGVTLRDNYVWFQLTRFVKFDLESYHSYHVSSGQPWQGIFSISKDNVMGGINVKAGRHGTPEVANFFKSGVTGMNIMLANANDNIFVPSKLNFMIQGNLSFTVAGEWVHCGPGFRIGQGHVLGYNNWWIGAPFCKRIGGAETDLGALNCTCPSGLTASFGSGGTNNVRILKANDLEFDAHSKMHANEIILKNAHDSGTASFNMSRYVITARQPFDGVDDTDKQGMVVWAGRRNSQTVTDQFNDGVGGSIGYDRQHPSGRNMNFFVAGTFTFSANHRIVHCGTDFRVGQGMGGFSTSGPNPWWLGSPICSPGVQGLNCACEGGNVHIWFDSLGVISGVPTFRWNITSVNSRLLHGFN